MKNIIGIFLFTLLITFSFAQEMEEVTSNSSEEKNPQVLGKKGQDIMPIAGEWGIGINASSLINNVLGTFGDGPNATGSSYFVNGGVYGKYFLTNSSAIRAGFNLFAQNDADRVTVSNDNATLTHPDSVVFDISHFYQNDYNFTVGYEMRQGKSRFRAVYGGNMNFGLSYQRNVYEYANEMGEANTRPSINVGAYRNNNERIINDQSTGNITLGVRGFLGVEYFFAPKVCVGTEFGLLASKTWSRDIVETLEYWDVTDNELKTKEDRRSINAGRRDFTLSTDNFNNSLYLMIFF